MSNNFDLLNQIDLGFIVIDNTLSIVFWNKWMEKYFEVPKNNAIGKNITELINNIHPRLIEAINETLSTGSSTILSDRFAKNMIPMFHNKSDKINMDQKIRVTRIKGDQNNKLALVQINDMTVSNQRELYLTKQTKINDEKTKELELQNKMASLGRMASGIVHEINNPITIIKGYEISYNHLRKKDPFDLEKMDQMFLKIQSMADRISHIIKGLKIIAHKDTFEFNTLVSIKKIVEESVELSKPKLENTNVIIDMESISEDYEVWCDAIQISQIIINLISNAIDAISPQHAPWIYIYACTKDKFYEIRVLDSGKGIPADIAKQIFDPFFTSKKVGKGTGLGLSISQKIAEAHKGELYIEPNQPNTTFVLKLVQSKFWGNN